MRIATITAWVGIAAGCACLPEFEDTSWLIDAPRIVAVRATPAEARPGMAVSYAALVIGPGGVVAAPVNLAHCLEPRTADERGAVSAACARGEQLVAIAGNATIPADACARFGPNPPAPGPDELPIRPSDPDATGGFYLPVRATIAQGDVAFGLHRIRCDLAGATRVIFDQFQAEYRANEHPVPGPLLVTSQADPSACPLPGTRVTVGLAIAQDQQEFYPVYVQQEGRLIGHQETIAVRWYVTGGEIGETIRGVNVLDGSLELSTDWDLPLDVASVTAWAVVGDERGGVAWRSIQLDWAACKAGFDG